MLKVIQSCKRDYETGSRKCQATRTSQALLPIHRGEEKQNHRQQRHDGELKDVCQRAFIRQRRLRVPDEYCSQRRKRQDAYDVAAKAVDSLPAPGVTSFSGKFVLPSSIRSPDGTARG